jgi:excisionase family DNA binding protein
MHEIAELLGVSRQYVDRLTRDDDTFPAPVVELRSGRVWKREDVEAWAKKVGRR